MLSKKNHATQRAASCKERLHWVTVLPKNRQHFEQFAPRQLSRPFFCLPRRASCTLRPFESATPRFAKDCLCLCNLRPRREAFCFDFARFWLQAGMVRFATGYILISFGSQHACTIWTSTPKKAFKKLLPCALQKTFALCFVASCCPGHKLNIKKNVRRCCIHWLHVPWVLVSFFRLFKAEFSPRMQMFSTCISAISCLCASILRCSLSISSLCCWIITYCRSMISSCLLIVLFWFSVNNRSSVPLSLQSYCFMVVTIINGSDCFNDSILFSHW